MELDRPQVQASIGRYRLLHRLGIGGMAEVFLAQATEGFGYEKVVALKRVRHELIANNRIQNMMFEEARISASLRHPNLVEAYDVGQDQSGTFFTMEVVEGEELRHVVKATQRLGGQLPLSHVLAIGIGIAAGLHHAHEGIAPDGSPLGIVHLDVCPSNILVTYDGEVKLIDFGIAQSEQRLLPYDVNAPQGGTVGYMSPEQVWGDHVDRRSDIYSLGVILWELTTWKRLFRGRDGEVLARIASGDVPRPSRVRRGYSRELEAVVMRALARDADERYESAEQLQLALEQLAFESGLVPSWARLGEYMRGIFSTELEPEQPRQLLRSA